MNLGAEVGGMHDASQRSQVRQATAMVMMPAAPVMMMVLVMVVNHGPVRAAVLRSSMSHDGHEQHDDDECDALHDSPRSIRSGEPFAADHRTRRHCASKHARIF